jgi:membrane protease YdiL (CAAX protease family)
MRKGKEKGELQMKVFLKIVVTLLLALILLIAPRIGGFVAGLFNYSAIDPDGAFMWISIHHIVQALVILPIMLILSRIFKIKFNLGLGDKVAGMKYLKRFILVFSVYTLVAYIVTMVSGGVVSFAYPLSTTNIVGHLGFQLLLSGPSEELVFRAFAISVFAGLVTSKRLNKHLSYAVLFASLIFGIAHISFSFNPFVMSYSVFQVFYAIVLGYFYGDCYEKSKSFIYPMIMHSYSNVLMIGVAVIISLLS